MLTKTDGWRQPTAPKVAGESLARRLLFIACAVILVGGFISLMVKTAEWQVAHLTAQWQASAPAVSIKCSCP